MSDTETRDEGLVEAGRAVSDPDVPRFAPPREPDRSGVLTGTRDHGIWYGIWHPAGRAEPDRGTVVLVHGFGEYTGRLGQLIRALNGHGYTVVAPDVRGHGRSEGARFRISRFDDFVEDLDLIVDIAREAAERRGTGDRSPFLFGHSMGGLIATRYVLALPDQQELAGLILSSPALQLPIDPPPPVYRLLGGLSRLVPRLPIPRDNTAGLSSDPEIARLWKLDPLLNHGPTSLQMAYQMAAAGRNARQRLDRITLPTLLIYGEADTVVVPAGSRTFADRVGSADLTVRPFPGLLHETFNEPAGPEIIAGVVGWLDEQVARCSRATV
ncbi:MAG TPA: alpha/beta hydrolase [Thermomicrobiales bacterium]|jgi:alpha-beta hydrolase superfamily lysophospholipase|nr:alpha/beta hydrolase [Thermomicrobiales bacterium]